MVMRATTLWLWMLWLGWATTLQAADASQPDQLVAEDFLLHDVVGASSLAAALRAYSPASVPLQHGPGS